ncbi:MAG: HD domain-containing protein, partial [Planctomycetota bacterium]
VVDCAGRFVAANGRLAGLFQMRRESITGRSLLSVGQAPRDAAVRDEAVWSTSDEFESEFEVITPDGAAHPVLLNAGSLVQGDQRVVVFQPINRFARQEQDFQERYAELSRLSDVILEQALDLKRYSSNLEEMVRARTAELHAANMDAIYMLAIASEAKDHDTGAHVRRIETYARRMARGLGLSEEQAECIGYSSILHDVGKFHIPDHILQKPGELTDEERALIESHTVAGERILGTNPFFETARLIARSHHENWDGSGYPDRIAGEDIPLPARIVRLVDVYDALVSERVYKTAWDPVQAVDLILQGAGELFDPKLTEVFAELHRRGGFDPDLESSRSSDF